MESTLGLLWLLITTLAIIHIVQADDQQGFISLDCGLSENELSPYKETYTGLLFSSDEEFIQSGETARVQGNNLHKPYRTVRYFRNGTRNCYNLIVEKGRKYLIRASFVYGNYDGLDNNPEFDLYLGPNLWDTIYLETRGNRTLREILHIPTSNSLQICLVKTGNTTPLISSLELRPMGHDSYITESGSLSLSFRYYLSNSGSPIRYSNDVYDRIWDSYFQEGWTQISTAFEVDNSNNDYVPPKDVLKNAVTPTNTSAPLTIEWNSQNPDDQYYLYAHFAEIQDLQADETRAFNILFNGQHYYGPLIPPKLKIATLFRKSPCDGGKCSFQLIRTKNSTLPPLLNSFELYKVIQFPQSETDESDVVAITNITTTYELSIINWQGDPCFPQQLRWNAFNCSNTNMSMPPRITYLNFSSCGLTGTIADAIQNLTQLETLDLSNNHLIGKVPEFLGNMKSLSFINLRGNNLKGSIPRTLQRKEGLELYVEENPRLCLSDSCKKNSDVPIVTSIVAAAIVIAVLVFFLLLRKKKSTAVEGVPPKTPTVDVTFDQKRTRFTYPEVIQMTKNFQKVLGKGGLGEVYHGIVNVYAQVAVKVLSQSLAQGYKQFKAEVDLLLSVHHTNLVSLVGYCCEEDNLALIYEFLPNGDLKQLLSGKNGGSIIKWSSRLQLALDAALGLEYLHVRCTPPIVHRDVKSANILLDEHFNAKLTDFGLSRSVHVGDESQDYTAIPVTTGYLDPEYDHTSRLGEKSDVYSFGIVLLEMITNQPVISQSSENSHITEWVGLKLKGGDITKIMDPNLCGDYDSKSVRKALELAMSCADPSSSKRPNMSQVITELKDCLVCENLRMSVKTPGGLESQEMSISLGTSVTSMER